VSDWFPTFSFLNKPPSVSNPPWPSPYHVPNSNNMIICPAFGLSMDADAIRNLIIFSETVVSLQVELHAENTKIPSNDGQQQFRNNVGGSQIKYWNAPRHELIWSDMSDLLRGLYNYLVAGKTRISVSFQIPSWKIGSCGAGVCHHGQCRYSRGQTKDTYSY